MTLWGALMNSSRPVPGLWRISLIFPPARIVDGLQSLATGSYAFVGSAEAEMKLTDSVNGALLVEAVDQRAGGMGLKSAASFEWGDAQNAMDYWAQKIPARITQLQGKTS